MSVTHKIYKEINIKINNIMQQYICVNGVAE